ncbi:PREDICTED: larval serum protein 1 gamma chain-like [Nicrophorus vespilloides]|uniref:Larval serum protein 1 gamma chain-like n=1 Tax=Nicrophorus vespilloides TaxID=110193 RepID=A0ABM1MG63_NICVS|nr:PREDICTED: larval serum protein 1 gamma chain-like [Nicrophorus vespilloides]
MSSKYKIADQVFLKKQKDVLRLFKNVMQPSAYEDIIEIAENFKFEDRWDQWTEPEEIKHFWKCFNNNFLKINDTFNVYYPEHSRQCRSLISIFIYAKDYATFFRCAAWSRQNINACMFVYVLSVALVHTTFTKGIILPPIYEILPQHFYNESKTVANSNVKNNIDYLTEDVGYNSYYHYKHVYVARILENNVMYVDADRRGDYFYYYHTQIMARHHLELLSNGRAEAKKINYNDFSGRNVSKDFLPKIIELERRICEAIDIGWAYDKNGNKKSLRDVDSLRTLGKIIEDDPDSPNQEYYGNFQYYARYLLGNHSLKHYETSMSDPLFYNFIKNILDLFVRYQYRMGPYSKLDLLFDGVKINDFIIDKLVTFFDLFTYDSSNGLVQQKRLNHKPFTYKIHVKSNTSVDAVVKFYIGPKLADFASMDDNRLNFFELDRFTIRLNEGDNVIERNSDDIVFFSPDRFGYSEFCNKIDDALSGKEPFKRFPYYNYYTFPRRLMLPKGDVSGQQFQVFVAILQQRSLPTDDFEFQVVDKTYSIGFPLDRPILYKEDFWVPNFFSKEVNIFHES